MFVVTSRDAMTVDYCAEKFSEAYRAASIYAYIHDEALIISSELREDENRPEVWHVWEELGVVKAKVIS